MAMDANDWYRCFHVRVPLEVAEDGTPLCAYNGCRGCNTCRAIAAGAPTITRDDALRKRELAELDRLKAKYGHG